MLTSFPIVPFHRRQTVQMRPGDSCPQRRSQAQMPYYRSRLSIQLQFPRSPYSFTLLGLTEPNSAESTRRVNLDVRHRCETRWVRRDLARPLSPLPLSWWTQQRRGHEERHEGWDIDRECRPRCQRSRGLTRIMRCGRKRGEGEWNMKQGWV